MNLLSRPLRAVSRVGSNFVTKKVRQGGFFIHPTAQKYVSEN
jgi:hypothetical protein